MVYLNVDATVEVLEVCKDDDDDQEVEVDDHDETDGCCYGRVVIYLLVG